MKARTIFTLLLIFALLTTLSAADASRSVLNVNTQVLADNTQSGAITESVTVSLPFSEGFETVIEGWSVVDLDGDGVYWARYEDSLYAHTGSFFAAIEWNSAGNNDWLITPEIDLPAESTISFSFWARSYDPFFPETFAVRILTDSTTENSILIGGESDIPATYTNYSYDLSSYAGQTIRLAVVCLSIDQFYLCVDDFLVESSGGSELLADFTTDVTQGSAPLTVNFTDLSTGATTWEWDFDHDGILDATATPSPSYTYENAGTYTVSLTVTDGSGTADTETKTDYITVLSGGAITSTTLGGNWSEPTTWVGGVVPTASDNVMIGGNVVVDYNSECHDLTIQAGNSLQSGTGFYQNLTVNGVLNNGGTIQNNGDTDLNLILKGHLNNSGVIENDEIMFNGTSDQYISMTSDALFKQVHFGAKDSTTSVILTSDLMITDCEIDFNWSEETTRLIIPEGSGFSLQLLGANCFVTDVILEGNGNVLYMSRGAYLYQDSYLSNIKLAGTVQSGAQSVTFTGDSVVVLDTLQSHTGFYNTLHANSTLINRGIIQDVGDTELYLETMGDLLNYGRWDNDETRLKGLTDQKIHLLGDQTFSSTMEIYAMIGTETYQWYKNNTLLPGETSSFLAINSLTSENFGIYYCSTNEGNSRNISIISDNTLLQADFLADVTSGQSPLTVNFTNTSLGDIVSYDWSFGDGNSSSEENPQYVYTETGIYTVSLTVSDELTSDTETKTDYITVLPSATSITSTTEGGLWTDGSTWIGGIAPTESDNVIIDGPVVVNEDRSCRDLQVNSGATLENYKYFNRTLIVNGSLTNEGLIRDDPGTYHDFTLEVHGNLINKGQWENFRSICSGESDQMITMDTGAEFNYGNLENADSASALIAGSDLTFSQGFTVDLGDNYSRSGQLILPSNSGFDITLDSAYIEFTSLHGNGNKLYLKNESSINSQVFIQDMVLKGTLNLRGYSTIIKGNSVLEDTLQNASDAGRKLMIQGHFTNNGIVRDYPEGYTYLWIDIQGELVNSGLWTNSKTTFNGTTNQIITLVNNESIDADFVLEAMAGTGSYQWYVNDTPISGETNDNLFLSSLEPGNIYYCSTNEGNSRIISIIGEEPGDSDWEIIATLPIPIRDLHFIDTSIGFAVGGGSIYSSEGGGKIYKTTDGGKDWFELSLPGDPPFSSVYFTDPLNGWLVGGKTSECRIFHTSDGGDTWTEQVSAVNTRPTSVYFVNSTHGWVTNDAGKIQHTHDGGANWVNQNSTTSEHMMDIFFADENMGWAGGQYATILHTTDGGNTWTAQNSTIPHPSSDSRGFGFMDFTDPNTGWICGDNGWIVHTNDGGTNWTIQETPAGGIHLRSIDFMNNSNGIAVGSMGTVLQTSDGGEVWEKIPFDNSNWLSDVYVINDSIGFISDAEGNIYQNSEKSYSGFQADFIADKTSGIAPLTVSFTDQSVGSVESWQWNFGDEATSSDQHPEHTYDTPGIYSVSLTVSDGVNQSTETKSEFIHVIEPIHEPSGWFWQNPIPHAIAIQAIEILDENTAVAVGGAGLIQKTTDGGNTWAITPNSITTTLYDVHFVNESQGWIVGGGGTMLKTNDGGETWAPGDSVVSNTLYTVVFTDQQNGYAAGHVSWTDPEGALLRTTDGGETWQKTNKSEYCETSYNDLCFPESDIGYAVTKGSSSSEAPRVLKTTDGGENWSIVYSGTDYSDPFECVYFLNSNLGWVGTYEGNVLKTVDGGDTWTTVEDVIFRSYAIYFVDENHGWTGGQNGGTAITSDGGQTWETMSTGNSNTIYDIKFIDTNRGVMVGDAGTMLSTEDGGTTWQSLRKEFTDEDINDIFFIDPLNGWAVGGKTYSGIIMMTQNGGHQWEIYPEEIPNSLHGVFFLNSQTGWAVGSNDTYGSDESLIYKTVDGGETWSLQNPGVSTVLYDVFFVDENTGWAVGGSFSSSVIIKTSDGGETWTEQTTSAEKALKTIQFLDSDNGWIAGRGPALMRTENGGETWIDVETPLSYGTFYALEFITPATGYLTGSSNIYKTTDSGETWNELEFDNYDDLFTVDFVTEEEGWILSSGTIFHTVDGGSSWTIQFQNSSVWMSQLFALDEKTAWIVGNNGLILKTSSGGDVYVGIDKPKQDGSPPIADAYQLDQNYPNPFNPTTTISYGLPEATRVRVDVYDIRGCHVVQLVNEYQNAGRYTLVWDGTSAGGQVIGSGMYIYRLSTPTMSIVKKMIFLK